jgi:hypothetical protein
MKRNVGVFDKVFRITVAVIIALLYYFLDITGTVGLVLIILAAVFLLTGLFNFCGLYTLFGINTCSKKK